MFFLWERRDGSPIIVAGPCWPFCVFFTLPLILILSGLVAYFTFFADFDGMRRLVRTFYLIVLIVAFYFLKNHHNSFLILIIKINNSSDSQVGLLLYILPWSE